MIISDLSRHPSFAPAAQAAEDALVRLIPAEERLRAALPPFPPGSIEDEWRHPAYVAEARINHVFRYLYKRAFRQLDGQLRAAYVSQWGKRASFSYFFPEHTRNPIWRRAHARCADAR